MRADIGSVLVYNVLLEESGDETFTARWLLSDDAVIVAAVGEVAGALSVCAAAADRRRVAFTPRFNRVASQGELEEILHDGCRSPEGGSIPDGLHGQRDYSVTVVAGPEELPGPRLVIGPLSHPGTFKVDCIRWEDPHRDVGSESFLYSALVSLILKKYFTLHWAAKGERSLRDKLPRTKLPTTRLGCSSVKGA